MEEKVMKNMKKFAALALAAVNDLLSGGMRKRRR